MERWSDLDLIYEKELGAGSFGKVFQVFSKKSKERYALKQISIESYMQKKPSSGVNCDKPIDTLCREIQILRRLNCDYVVKYLESWFEGPDKDDLDRLNNCSITSDVSSTFTIQMLNFLYIKMELCDTTLSHWLDTKRDDGKSYDDERELLKNVFTQIFQALAYIHEKGIIHRDLKPANVLMNNDLVKLGDFGLAIEHFDEKNRELTAFVGSPHYRSPEVDAGINSKYDNKSDMFSVGLMLLEFYFLDKSKQIIHQLFVQLRDGNSRALNGFPDSIEMKLIKKLTTYGAESRLSASQALEAISNPDNLLSIDEPIQNILISLPEDEDYVIHRIQFGFHQPAANFVGRQKELEFIHSFAQSNQRILLIAAMAGQGKTELCKTFIQEWINKLQDKSNFIATWFAGETIENFKDSLFKFAHEILKINIKTADNKELPVSHIVEEIHKKLVSKFNQNKWLIAIDNVDNDCKELQETVSQLVNNKCPVFMLITSKLRSIFDNTLKTLDLLPLKEKDAVELIKCRLENATEEEAKMLCTNLGSHALSIQLSISFILSSSKRQKYGIPDFLKVLDKNKVSFGNEQSSPLVPYEKNFFNIIQHNIEMLPEMYPQSGEGKVAVEILKLISILLPDNNDANFIYKLVQAVPGIVQSELPLTLSLILDMLHLLNGHCLVTLLNDDNSFTVHRMVQKATKQGSQDSVVTILNLILSSDFINSNVKSHQDLNQMLNVWQQAMNSEVSSLITSHASRTSQLSYKLIEFSRLGEALQFTKSQFDLLSKMLPINHLECLNIEHCVALATEKTGDPLGALQKYESVLKKKQLYSEENDDSTLETGYEMSFVLWQLKQFDRAFSLGEKVHQTRVTKLGDDNIKTMRSRNNVALVLRDKGKLKEALTLFHQVIKWNEKNLGMNHRTTLITYHNIATCYFFQENYEEAFSRFQKVTELEANALGKDNAMTLRSQSWLGWTHLKRGDTEEAVNMIRDVLSRQEKLLGEHHPDTKFTSKNLESIKASGQLMTRFKRLIFQK